jgi:hypothetical protein
LGVKKRGVEVEVAGGLTGVSCAVSPLMIGIFAELSN